MYNTATHPLFNVCSDPPLYMYTQNGGCILTIFCYLAMNLNIIMTHLVFKGRAASHK